VTDDPSHPEVDQREVAVGPADNAAGISLSDVVVIADPRQLMPAGDADDTQRAWEEQRPITDFRAVLVLLVMMVLAVLLMLAIGPGRG
jgi:hypothetical protein